MGSAGKLDICFLYRRAAGVPIVRRRGQQVLLAMLSGVLLCLPWVDGSLYWTAWFGWLPLLCALQGVSPLRAALLGWLTGSMFYLGTAYWMVHFAIHLKGLSLPLSVLLAALFWIYCGAAIGLGCLLYRWLARRLPQLVLLSFPLSIVGVCALFPGLFDIRFSETQAAFLIAIQGADVVGAQGMDLLILLVNGLLFQLLAGVRGRVASALAATGAVLVLVWFVYGWQALAHWDAEVANWQRMRVGLVQPNDAPTRRIPAPPAGYSRQYPEEMEASRRLAAAGARWVVWPEARYKGYFDHQSVRQAYADQVLAMGADLLFHDVETRNRHAEPISYNTMGWLRRDGELAERYRKMLRVPFGEYLPAFWQLPGISTLTHAVLGDYLRPVGAGDVHTRFAIDGMQVVPKICYETAFPEFIADAIGDEVSGAVLLFVSQDNWFGETSQPFQHRAISIMRAVENRVPMVHLINNGPSVAAAPNGRPLAGTPAFSRAELLVDLPYSVSAQASFYGRHAHLLGRLWLAMLAALILLAILLVRRQGRDAGTAEVHGTR